MDEQYKKFEGYFKKYEVSNLDFTSKEYFSASIMIAIEEYGLSDIILADEFKVSPNTINRWREGTSIPPEYSRKIILERILERI